MISLDFNLLINLKKRNESEIRKKKKIQKSRKKYQIGMICQKMNKFNNNKIYKNKIKFRKLLNNLNNNK